MRLLLTTLMMLFLFLSTGDLAAQPTPLIFWHFYADERGEALEVLVAKYNQNAAIPVEAQYFPGYDQLHDAMLSALVQGGTPHLILARPEHAALYQLSGVLVDLTTFTTASDAENIHPLIWSQDVYRGERLGFPLTRAYPALYINMTMLRELGFDAPPLNRTEMGVMACGYFQQHFRPGYEIPLDGSFFLTLAQPADFYVNGDFQFDTPEMRSLIGFLQAQISGQCGRLNPETLAQAQQRFASGQTLFYMDASSAQGYVAAAIRDFYAEPFEMQIIPLPTEEGRVVNLMGFSLSVVRHTPEQDKAAWEFIAWLAAPERMERWAAVTHTLPSDLNVVQPDDPVMQATWMIEPAFPGYDLIRDEVAFTLRGILTGVSLLDIALAQLEQIAHEIQAAFVLE